MKNNMLKNMIIIIAIIFFMVFAFKLFINTDGMETAGINKIKYRTYTDKEGWSKWSKNGGTSGTLKYPITAIEIKINGNAGFLYSYYTSKNEWSNTTESHESLFKSYEVIDSNDSIKGIKFALFNNSTKYYNLCYRTHNKKNGWLEWTCDVDGISGNKDESVTGIEMKMIPKNIIKNEYLKDFHWNKNESSIGF